MSILVILLMIMSTSGIEQDTALSQIRGLYQRAAEDETVGKKLLKSTEAFDENNPVFFGYYGAAHMMMAKHVINPFSKMSHFNKGKKIYTRAIQLAPENIELRFLRFAVQSKTPGFLGYKENLEEDKNFLLSQIKEVSDRELYKMIVEYLLTSKSLSVAEKEKLE